MFKVQSVVFLFVAAIVLPLACSAVLEAGTIKYQASADPTTIDGDLGQAGVQSWVPDGAGTTGTASTGGGGPIWLVENAAGNRWSLAPVSADNESAWQNGWTIDMNYVIPVGSATCSMWSKRFCLEFGNDTHGIRLYHAVYDTTMPQYDAKFHLDIGNGTSFVAAPGISSVIDVNGNHTGQLHTLKLVYTPGTGAGTGLDMFMDNELRINDLQLPAATDDCTLRWGRDGTAGSVAGCYVGYESVTLSSVPEPNAAILLTTGLVGLLAYAWRKRK